jgi:hypothetical protein
MVSAGDDAGTAPPPGGGQERFDHGTTGTTEA